MRRAAFLIGAALVIVPALRASASDFAASAMNLYTMCNGAPDGVGDVFCGGYTLGVYHGLMLGQELRATKGTTCLPTDMSGEQVRLIVKKYMQDHPKELNRREWTVVAAALEDAFPCPSR